MQKYSRAVGMAQWLRALVVLAGDRGQFYSPLTPGLVDLTHFLPSVSTHEYESHTDNRTHACR